MKSLVADMAIFRCGLKCLLCSRGKRSDFSRDPFREPSRKSGVANAKEQIHAANSNAIMMRANGILLADENIIELRSLCKSQGKTIIEVVAVVPAVSVSNESTTRNNCNMRSTWNKFSHDCVPSVLRMRRAAVLYVSVHDYSAMVEEVSADSS